ncbi:hypothetical protein [Streptosporangium lutulentum]|uniref:DUF5666 domain-containing protein n=1 Tax=Streptosporangium lutulentum TaxID=1461250 RepID=A0ABT9QJ92_9ACTN|nr:hypothetical protein [Streptosporangium lutulentum]MDP9846825.1 hypothetical protein [Streptosporangium lutulentum]
MKKRLILGASTVTAAILLMGSSAWAIESVTPASDGVTTIAKRPPKANAKPRKAKARARMAGIHGQATVGGKDSTFVERTWQRGVITAKSESSLTVKSKDGVTWTWTLDRSTRIHKLGARADLSKLVAGSTGDKVFVIGTATSANPTATSVFAPRKPAAPTAPTAPTAPAPAAPTAQEPPVTSGS